eukprot:TRINITY_DN6957_c0_g1_i1.p1 TRINITY_DN6957_c0_g1~~TRINITY_DN6957_c0_g1_i1.p1  ORF type:complete len:454 (+),score=95.81 TRINITY_DN6957_c0_g1_i1:1464-2825(+)
MSLVSCQDLKVRQFTARGLAEMASFKENRYHMKEIGCIEAFLELASSNDLNLQQNATAGLAKFAENYQMSFKEHRYVTLLLDFMRNANDPVILENSSAALANLVTGPKGTMGFMKDQGCIDIFLDHMTRSSHLFDGELDISGKGPHSLYLNCLCGVVNFTYDAECQAQLREKGCVDLLISLMDSRHFLLQLYSFNGLYNLAHFQETNFMMMEKGIIPVLLRYITIGDDLQRFASLCFQCTKQFDESLNFIALHPIYLSQIVSHVVMHKTPVVSEFLDCVGHSKKIKLTLNVLASLGNHYPSALICLSLLDPWSYTDKMKKKFCSLITNYANPPSTPPPIPTSKFLLQDYELHQLHQPHQLHHPHLTTPFKLSLLLMTLNCLFVDRVLPTRTKVSTNTSTTTSTGTSTTTSTVSSFPSLILPPFPFPFPVPPANILAPVLCVDTTASLLHHQEV